jgi:aminoglycoside 6'-N-acetyltransferase I
MNIAQATLEDIPEWRDLALKLWPEGSSEEMQESLTEILQSSREDGFLVRDDDGRAIAFINLSLRSDYVPDATQSPTAYVEGIYVDDGYRHRGLGKALIQHAERWAMENGCVELASDALIDNAESYEFHTSVGFREVERVVCFIKPIGP